MNEEPEIRNSMQSSKSSCTLPILLLLLAVSSASAASPQEIIVSSPIKIAGGRMNVIWHVDQTARQIKRDGFYDVLLHFHGNAKVASEQFAKADLGAVLVVVNFNGLSSAYSTPFRESPTLLNRILAITANTLHRNDVAPNTVIERDLFLSSFSAGYGAVRQILKSPTTFGRIDGYVAADSIYASIVKQESPERLVDPNQMKDFLAFAKSAASGDKQFILSHSSQSTDYASTTETARYLIEQVNSDETHAAAVVPPATSLETPNESWRPDRVRGHNRFVVYSYAGELAEDHLSHLRNISTFWSKLKLRPAAASQGVDLFGGDNLTGWYSWLAKHKYEDPNHVFSVIENRLCISGQELGYLATKQRHSNYVITVEFRWGAKNHGKRVGKARDSGLFLHASGADGNSADGDGAFMAAIECQIMEGAMGDLLLIRGRDNGRKIAVQLNSTVSPKRDAEGWPYYSATGETLAINTWGRLNRTGKRRDWVDRFGIADSSQIERVPNQWNELRCRCVDNMVIVSLNQQIVNVAHSVMPTSGKILLQSEGSELCFRRVHLSPLN